jgi:hypothetical protein
VTVVVVVVVVVSSMSGSVEMGLWVMRREVRPGIVVGRASMKDQEDMEL